MTHLDHRQESGVGRGLTGSGGLLGGSDHGRQVERSGQRNCKVTKHQVVKEAGGAAAATKRGGVSSVHCMLGVVAGGGLEAIPDD